jgi:hypothetical protein
MEYRPGLNGKLEWSCRKAANAIVVSKDRAARALIQLELLGWLTVERIGGFKSRNAARYALTMFANDVTGDPASHAFEHIDPDIALLRVAPRGQHSRISGTAASRHGDTKGHAGRLAPASDALKSSPIFTRLAEEDGRQAKP